MVTPACIPLGLSLKQQHVVPYLSHIEVAAGPSVVNIMRSGDGEGTYRPAEAEAAAWEEREGEDTEVSEGKAFNSGMRK